MVKNYAGDLYAGLAFRKRDNDSRLALEAQYNRSQEFVVRETTAPGFDTLDRRSRKRKSPDIRVCMMNAADLRKKIVAEGWEVDWHTRVSDLKR